MLPRLEVIADEHRVKTHLLGQNRKLQQFGWTELFGRGFVSQLEHDWSPLVAGTLPPARITRQPDQFTAHIVCTAYRRGPVDADDSLVLRQIAAIDIHRDHAPVAW